MYKYLESKYADLMLLYGSIRVGTLYDFRKSEHKAGIADPQEGKKSLKHNVKQLIITPDNWSKEQSNPDFLALKQLGVLSIEKGATVNIINVSAQAIVDSPNCFIYCTSTEQSKRVMNQFEGSDTCIFLKDPFSFFKIITQRLQEIHPVTFEGAEHVTYKSRTENWQMNTPGVHPALTKEPAFEPQREIRAVWTVPPEYEIKRAVLVCKELPRYIEKIHLDKTSDSTAPTPSPTA